MDPIPHDPTSTLIPAEPAEPDDTGSSGEVPARGKRRKTDPWVVLGGTVLMALGGSVAGVVLGMVTSIAIGSLAFEELPAEPEPAEPTDAEPEARAEAEPSHAEPARSEPAVSEADAEPEPAPAPEPRADRRARHAEPAARPAAEPHAMRRAEPRAGAEPRARVHPEPVARAAPRPPPPETVAAEPIAHEPVARAEPAEDTAVAAAIDVEPVHDVPVDEAPEQDGVGTEDAVVEATPIPRARRTPSGTAETGEPGEVGEAASGEAEMDSVEEVAVADAEPVDAHAPDEADAALAVGAHRVEPGEQARPHGEGEGEGDGEHEEAGRLLWFPLGPVPQLGEAGGIKATGWGGVSDPVAGAAGVALELGLLRRLALGVATAFEDGEVVPEAELAVAPVVAHHWRLSAAFGAGFPVGATPTAGGSVRASFDVGPIELGGSVAGELERAGAGGEGAEGAEPIAEPGGAGFALVPTARLHVSAPGAWVPAAELAFTYAEGAPSLAGAVGLAVNPVHGLQIAGFGVWTGGPGATLAVSYEGTPFSRDR